MKKLLPLLLCILLLSGCAATYDGPTEETLMLTDYTVRHYAFGGEGYTESQSYAYDIYGNRVRVMYNGPEGLESVKNLRYDEAGHVIEEVRWDHTGIIPLPESRVETTYDDQGRMLKRTFFDGWGREESHSTYTYDDAARTRTWQNDSGDTVTTWYDEAGRETRVVSDTYETVYEYGENGSQLGWVTYVDGVCFERYEARYDGQNRQIWSGCYDGNGELVFQTEFTYDGDACTQTTHLPNGGVRIEYYAADGRLTLIEDYDGDGNLTMYQQYTYRAMKVPKEEETP